MMIYLGMGWACTYDLSGLRTVHFQRRDFYWLAVGGMAYTRRGFIFYVLDKMKKLDHAHGIWHIFVLAGSVSHFIAVIGYVR